MARIYGIAVYGAISLHRIVSAARDSQHRGAGETRAVIARIHVASAGCNPPHACMQSQSAEATGQIASAALLLGTAAAIDALGGLLGG